MHVSELPLIKYFSKDLLFTTLSRNLFSIHGPSTRAPTRKKVYKFCKSQSREYEAAASYSTIKVTCTPPPTLVVVVVFRKNYLILLHLEQYNCSLTCFHVLLFNLQTKQSYAFCSIFVLRSRFTAFLLKEKKAKLFFFFLYLVSEGNIDVSQMVRALEQHLFFTYLPSGARTQYV